MVWLNVHCFQLNPLVRILYLVVGGIKEIIVISRVHGIIKLKLLVKQLNILGKQILIVLKLLCPAGIIITSLLVKWLAASGMDLGVLRKAAGIMQQIQHALIMQNACGLEVLKVAGVLKKIAGVIGQMKHAQKMLIVLGIVYGKRLEPVRILCVLIFLIMIHVVQK